MPPNPQLRIPELNKFRILNLGAGVQSTTIALMGIKNWEYWHCSEPLPYPAVGLITHAIFADTQEEPKAVYKHLEWLELACRFFFPILVRTAGKLGDQLVNGVPLRPTGKALEKTRFISIPAFVTQTPGKAEGITPRECTRDYKLDMIDRTIRREILSLKPRQRVPSDIELTQLLGLSYDEAGRIARVKARHVGNPFSLEFPLFAMEMTRGGCKAWLKKWYPNQEVPRSACVFCPYHSQAEWRTIRSVKEDWNRACEVDRSLRDMSSRCMRNRNLLAYIHKDCVPLDQADLDDPETKDRKKGQEMFGFLNECEGMCGV